MRQVAWLHARPKSAGGKPGATSRLQRLTERGDAPDLPDPGPAGYLAGWLFEAGPVSAAGMGPAPLSWPDLQAWAQATATPLRPWEARLLRQASGEYLSELQAAEAPDRPAPWTQTLPTAERRAAVSDRLGAFFGARARQPAQPRSLGH